MARTAKAAKKPDAAADNSAALEASRQRWWDHLDRTDKLPPSWAVDWTPDGTKPCSACGGREWAGGAGGWCCTTCHPPTPKQAERLRFAPIQEVA